MSCISRQVGHEPVEPGFAKVKGRPTWAIPWMEDDPALSSVQLWAGRMRKDAADALAYGCTGLLGIHWRTRILGPNVSALADAAWDQKAWNPAMNRQLKAAVEKAKGGRKRFLPVEDFYADWALAHFGPEAAKPIGQLFAGLDGYLPRPADWVHGPGGNRPDPRPWQQVAKEYAFVDELAEFSSGIQGEGNRERFDYWLNSFRYLRAMAQVNCTWARFNEAMKAVKAQKSPEAQKRLARERALPVRKELVAQVGQVHGYLLATITTYGELGTVANWQQHILPDLLVKPGQELAKIFGEPLPADAMPGKEHRGEPRLVVPTVRTNLTAGERLNLEATVIGPNAQEVAVYWRPLGAGQFAKVPCAHMARGVYAVTLPAEATKADLEYYVSAKFKPGELADRPHAGAERRDVLKFPATAPAMNQTVVVVGAE
ncbi:MAG: hypothetical protein A2234_04500 [Elusimicrobia bacterium RIFOXYA2_FULL_58_8]|nr:MAG: hypothetical protein A2234_04500 [Elusimicrobia bacterium RIFOXYA2_FULL_58_8]